MIAGDPIRTVPATALAVSLAELKAWARFDLDDEDAVWAGLIRAATDEVERYTGLSLITSTWTQTFSEWPPTKNPDLVLRRRPLQSVLSVTCLSGEGSPTGTPVVVDSSVYRVFGIGGDIVPGKIRLTTNATWPVLHTDPEAITVTYRAGFGDDHNSVPELIRLAVMLAANTHFGYREDIVMGSTVSEYLPFSSRNLLRSWRPIAVA